MSGLFVKSKRGYFLLWDYNERKVCENSVSLMLNIPCANIVNTPFTCKIQHALIISCQVMKL